jgi:hypothetical protein
MFVGYSKDHAMSIGCVLNVMTQSIIAPYHIVYDDWFFTIVNEGQIPPPNWQD